MVFINVLLFQRTIVHLVSHHSFTPSSLLSHKTHSQVFFSPSLTRYFSETRPLNLIGTVIFLLPHFFFLLLKPFSSFVLSFSVFTKGYMKGPCSSCIFDRTYNADILPWTRAKAALWLHWSTVSCASQETLTPNCDPLCCIAAVLVKIRFHFTYHLVAALITSCCHACTCTVLSCLTTGGIKPLLLLALLSCFTNSATQKAFYLHRIIQKYSAALDPMLTWIPWLPC